MQIGYYRLTKPVKDWEIGELWYLTSVENNRVHLLQYDGGWTMDLDQFIDCFEFAPDGIVSRQRDMTDLMNDMHKIGTRQDNLLTTAAVPCLPAPDDGVIVGELVDVEEEPAPVDDTAMVLAGSRSPAQVSQNLKVVKTQITFAKKNIARRQKELQLIIREQEMILRAKTDALTKQVEQAMEAIYMINAYLGKDEELVRIRMGEPAPADTKVVIRQLVLHMDEESAAADGWAKKGGIDFQSVEAFDKWIKVPKNLNQVLPEKKGIVAIKPRRHDKQYTDNPWENAELNKLNKCLYLVIRNGDILYRIYTSLRLGDVLFPRKDEFDHFFYSRWSSDEGQPLRAGSREYMDAMEKSAAQQRRFYTVLLLIQGIIDRTKVLQPMAEERVNILDLSQSTKYFTFLKDAENLLGDGRPDFDDWLKSINQQIEVGCRVVGNWSSYSNRYSGDDARVSPRSASSPNEDQIHVLEKDLSDDSFAFYYSREGETVYHGWDDYGGRPAKNRARYRVERGDRFFIHFDAATVEDMEYYMSSRLHRHGYLAMLPLMETAIKMKHEEEKVEAPFRKLLTAEIVKAHRCSFDVAGEQVNQLVHWWKFKNKNHRALTADDAKAIRMIVAEFGRRNELLQQQQKLAALSAQVIEVIRGDDAKALVIFHRKDREYGSYSFMNDENAFVREQHWQLSEDNELECIFDRSWKTADKRHESWVTLWQHERWAEWKIGANVNDYLTDEELEQLVKYAETQFRGENKKLLQHTYSYHTGKLWTKPISIGYYDGKVTCYFVQRHAVTPEKYITGKIEDPEIGRFEVNWEKKGGVLQLQRLRVRDRSGTNIDVQVFWTNKPTKSQYDSRSQGKRLRFHEDTLAEVIAEDKVCEELRAKKKKLGKKLRPMVEQCRDILTEIWYEEQRTRFNEEYTDPDGELWEFHKEELKKPTEWPDWVETAAEHLVEDGVSYKDFTVGQLVDEARLHHGFEIDLKKIKHYDRLKDVVLDQKYMAPEDEPEEDDDEDD